MHSVTNIVQLRQLLAERFPNALAKGRFKVQSSKFKVQCWATGLSQIDSLLEGGLAKGAITELVSRSAGSALVISALIRQAARNQQWAGLIDAQDSFDPAGFDNLELTRLLWVRCSKAEQALKASDFIVRDGNLQLVVLDLQMSPANELRKVSPTSWYRLQRCLEGNASALLVVTPRTMVAAAQARLELSSPSRIGLDALSCSSDELLNRLRFKLLRIHGIESHAEQEPELIAQVG